MNNLRVHTINTVPNANGATDVYIQVKTTTVGDGKDVMRITERAAQAMIGDLNTSLISSEEVQKLENKARDIEERMTEEIYLLENQVYEERQAKEAAENDLETAIKGLKDVREALVEADMPVLEAIPEAMKADQPLEGSKKKSCCLVS